MVFISLIHIENCKKIQADKILFINYKSLSSDTYYFYTEVLQTEVLSAVRPLIYVKQLKATSRMSLIKVRYESKIFRSFSSGLCCT